MISDTGGQKIEVAPKPVKLSLPPVPVKKVNLVPFGLEANDSLDWAPAYYEAKLGIEVSVLPPIGIDESLENAQRHQLHGDRCLRLSEQAFP